MSDYLLLRVVLHRMATRSTAAVPDCTIPRAILLRRRPAKGLLGGMHEVPSTDWVEGALPSVEPPFSADWSKTGSVVRHTFTHFHLELEVWTASARSDKKRIEGEWWEFENLGNAALPTVMMKIIKAAIHTARPKDEA